MYPALAALEQLLVDQSDVEILWVGGEGGMETGLISQAGLEFKAIPAAGVHGVSLRALPGNLIKLLQGFFAARNILRQFRPDVMFFTGGYVSVPVALAGMKIPVALFVPDIEPGLALKTLTHFADRITVSAKDSLAFYSRQRNVVVTGYPTRKELQNWDRTQAQKALGLDPELVTLLVFGGSKGARSINRALFSALPQLLPEMQIVHVTGELNWPEVEPVHKSLAGEVAERYYPYPYLHAEMGAAFKVADLVLSRAGASCLGEFPLFGLPAILVPYPHAWRYQKVNADYMIRQNAAVLLQDADLTGKFSKVVLDLVRDEKRRATMSAAMASLARPEAASSIANILIDLANNGSEQGKSS